MTVESFFLILATVALFILLIYEVVFVLFVKEIPSNKAEMKTEPSSADVMVQSRPLGYSEPPSSKIQQCNTPVFEFADVPVSEAKVSEDESKSVEAPLVQNIRKNSGGRAPPPTIVVSSPTPSF